MHRLHYTAFGALLLTLAAGCDPAEEETTDGSASADGSTSGETPTTTATTGTMPTTSATTTGESADDSTSGDSADGSSDSTGDDPTGSGNMAWHEVAGPCAGSGTNALWFDDRENGFVGCGENADGEGLYTTEDGAESFEDNVRFNEVRIMDIRRAADGVLYGAGIHQLDGYPVWSFDEGGAMLNSTGIYSGSGTTSQVSQAENASVSANGQVLVDSLTGTSAVYRPSGGEFEELDSLSEDLLDDPDAISFQVKRITDFEDSFYAVGSLINDPARVHLPSQLEGATYHFQSVLLQPDTRDGELQDMHVWSADHMIVAGHDQSERYPLIYLIDGGDPYSSEAWEKIELFDSGLDYQAGVNDLHVIGDTVVAVGEKIPTSGGGFIVLSQDGGRTYEDITPEGAGPLSRVWMFDDGEMVVAGGGGEMWVYADE